MTAIYRSILFLGFVTLLIAACAKPVNPSGGPKDKQAPKLDTLNSDSNFKSNFSGRKINLVFDEYITISNTSKEVVISPPTLYFPKFNQRGEKLSIEFDEREVLKEDATYQINFGNAIKDLNENNKLENFSYVFSTGDKIDSLSVKGRVIDDLTGAPEKDMLVMLYDQIEDSIVYKERPLYFARTDDAGKFEINNLRADTFKVFGLQDVNVNYYYDNAIEKIAYLDSTITLPLKDSTEIILYAFTEQSDPYIIGIDAKIPGLIKAVINVPDDNIDFTLSNTDLKTNTYLWNDSLYIYYTPVPDSSFYLITPLDSFKVAPRKAKPRKLNFRSSAPKMSASHYPNSNMLLSFSEPLSSFMDTLIAIKDTVNSFPVDYSLIKGKLNLKYDLKDSSVYSLELLPGAISNSLLTLEDSLSYRLNVAKAEDFGNIIIDGIKLVSTYNYIFKLERSNSTIAEKQIQNLESTIITFEHLPAGDYTLTVIEDRNGNGRWDPGNYGTKTKSENISTTILDKLRQSWDLNIEFDGSTFTDKN